VINVVRIMTAIEPKLITITVDGELSREYVDAVETCATQAIAQRRPTQLFLRDVSTIDESGRALLARLAAKGVRLRDAGVYCSYVVARISQSAA
jgi:ABC-type transporter Mla MlaB component